MDTASILPVAYNDKVGLGAIVEYYVPSIADYYAGRGGPPGRWGGEGAKFLALEGDVSRAELFNLLQGKSPDGSKRLVRIVKAKSESASPTASSQADEPIIAGIKAALEILESTTPNQKRKRKKKNKKRSEHVPGLDFTFSAPKPVSSLWAKAPPPIAKVIEGCQRRAVETTMGIAEKEIPLLRRGKSGEREELAKLTYAIFTHNAARNNHDPNLHDHVVLANVAIAPDGKIMKLNTNKLLHIARMLGPLYRNELCRELHRELGIEAARAIHNGKPAGWFTLKGVPDDLCKLWSSRTTEIHNQVDFEGLNASDVAAQKSANFATRHPKGELPTNEQLKAKWKAEARSLGHSWKTMQHAINREYSLDVNKELNMGVERAVAQLTSQKATFDRFEFIRAVSEEVQHVPVSARQVIDLADMALSQSQELRVVKDEQNVIVYTTKAMWEMEERVNEVVDKLAAKPGLKIPELYIDYHLKRNSHLTEEQQNAVQHVLKSEGSIACITGVAGAGKSTCLKVICEALEAEGKKLVGISTAGIAADNLQKKTGIECRTIESFLVNTEKGFEKDLDESIKHDLRMVARSARGLSTWSRHSFEIDKNTVVFWDEAGMGDTATFDRVLRQVIKAGAKIVFTGDLEQLPPIGAGTPFRSIVEKLGSAHLAENFRMKNDPLGLQAAQHLRDGDIEAALDIYVKKGDLHIAKDRSTAARQLVRQWAEDGGIQNPADAMILVQTREEARLLNRMCQDARRLESAISTSFVNIDQDRIHINDRIMICKTLRMRGLENGNRGTVVGINERGDLTVKLDKEMAPWQIKRGMSNVITLKSQELTSELIKLGYAATTHKAQSIDIPLAYYLAGGSMEHRRLVYTALSRSTAKTKIFSDRHHAGPELSAMEKSMSREVEKVSAHDVEQRRRIDRSDRSF